MHQDYLLTIAEVSGALLGFVGVVLVLGRRSEGLLSKRDESGLFHLIYSAAGALFFSLVMYACLVSFQNHETIWRVGLGLIVLYMLNGVTRAILEGRGGENRLGPVTRHLLSMTTFFVVVLNTVIVFGLFSPLAPFAFILSVTLMVGVAVSYFVPFVFVRSD